MQGGVAAAVGRGAVALGARLPRRPLAKAAAADAPAPLSPEPFDPLWGAPAQAERWCPIPAAEVVKENERMAGEPRLPLGTESAGLRVVDPIEPRTSGRPLSQATFGCYANKKNICRETLAGEVRQGLDTLVLNLNRFVDSAGIQNARAAEVLLWLRRRPPMEGAAGAQHVLLLLADARQRPKMQFFAPCRPTSSNDGNIFEWPEQYPFHVTIMQGISRLSPQFQGVKLMTSDEVCFELSGLGGAAWELSRPCWELAHTDSLLDMVITGGGEVFIGGVQAAPAHRSGHFKVPKEDLLDLDPCAFGEAMARTAIPLGQAPPLGPAASGGPLGEPGDGLQADGAEGPDFFMDDLLDVFAALPDVLQENSLGAFLDDERDEGEVLPTEASGSSADAKEPTSPTASASQAVEVAQSEQDEQAVGDEAALAVVEAEAEAPDLQPPPASSEEACAAAVLSPGGYITCPLVGWSPVAAVGRITTWPEDKPMHSRSVSCRCYLHTGCSVAKIRAKVSAEELMTWLFKGGLELSATPARKKTLGEEHRAMWRAMLPAGAGRARQKPPSGGAASSSHA